MAVTYLQAGSYRGGGGHRCDEASFKFGEGLRLKQGPKRINLFGVAEPSTDCLFQFWVTYNNFNNFEQI